MGSARQKVEKFRLGFVADPLPGHEPYRGMLAIPYIRRAETGDWSVVSIRYRCLEQHEHQGHGKYNTTPGDRPRLFNTFALMSSHDTIAVCEGELDAVTTTVCGVPAVGVPGVQAWRPHFTEAFLGYETVWILADGDDPGRMFARSLSGMLPNARIVGFPDGSDVSDFVMANGAGTLLERLR